ncbi:hypothetical protein CFI00_0220 [Nocardioides sp. S5]|uniref:HNH endonuclease n=1 Tax=Nocardioides sp. S5 TaxID=2017486 RepID=UPI001AF17CF5|nr:hypothetical protein [Nocardioides sp. S5]QSR33404.1 hypothetical protein CFI00_0220 [Nocardioides sp. S5]
MFLDKGLDVAAGIRQPLTATVASGPPVDLLDQLEALERIKAAAAAAHVRHLDHVQRDADGGRTTAVNGQGLCERCNYVKESPGWTSWVPTLPPGARHEVQGVTEHLRITRSTSPPLPGGPAGAPDYSPAERQLASSFTLAS